VWNAISKVMYRMLTLLIAIPVAKAMNRLINAAWRAARPDNPPHNPKRHNTRFIDAVTWSAITGVGWAATKLVTSKATAEMWRAAIGTEPPGTPPKPTQAQDEKGPISPLPVASDRSS
jgi:Protein of unknown function (DUF4235)